MQRRHKWRTKDKDFETDTLVLVRENNMPPLQWTLGRIHEMHSNQDNVVREATVRTPTGLLKRAVKGLCPPSEED